MSLKTTKYKQLRDDFATHIKATKSIKSGDHYTAHAVEFMEYLEEKGVFNIRKVSEDLMKEYHGYLSTRPNKRTGKPLSVRTVNDNMSSLRMFSIRLQEGGEIERGLPVPKNIKVEQPTNENGLSITRDILDEDEIKAVYEACQTNKEKALIALAYGCGLRRNELQELQEYSINYAKGLLTASVTKNNKTRMISISEFFLKDLRAYSMDRLEILRQTGLRTSNVFLNANGKRTSGDRLGKMLKAILARTTMQSIKEKTITLHCLRHSITVHLINAGESYEYIKEFLGHSFTDTSSIYAQKRRIKNYYTV